MLLGFSVMFVEISDIVFLQRGIRTGYIRMTNIVQNLFPVKLVSEFINLQTMPMILITRNEQFVHDLDYKITVVHTK